MDYSQLKLYRQSEWLKKRHEILERDNYVCSKCNRTHSESDLQVHHQHYRKDKKPWEYENFELTTLCKSCHAKEHGHIMPDYGWEYIVDDDLGELCGECDLCHSPIRYVHTLFHQSWGCISVGCVCADKLTGDFQASIREENRRKLAERYNRYICSPKWTVRLCKNGSTRHSITFDGFPIIIWENRFSTEYKLQITVSYRSKTGCITHKKLYGKGDYLFLDDAKSKAFEVITNGALQKFVNKKLSYQAGPNAIDDVSNHSVSD